MKFEDKIRVLIVDDSAVMRRIIMTSLMKHPDIEVVGTAGNGLLAIESIKRLNPDIVTLDVEMPEMDGITALREIRKSHPNLPIVMFSSTTQRGASDTMDALTYGASDYVGKPQAASDPAEAYRVLEENLIPKIKALCQRASEDNKKTIPLKERGAARREALSMPAPEKIITLPSAQNSLPLKAKVARPEGRPLYPVNALCIGVSTGGPAALMKVFELWRSPLPVPIFIVQHMPPKFTTLLAARLTEVGVMPVQEPYEGQEALAGHAYLAPGGYHLELRQKGTKVLMHLNEDPPENSCRPAVDVLFRSAAKVYGQSLLAVVLTGMGYDGLRGAEDIIRNNGVVLAQDEATSVIWGMPGAIAQADLAEKILPLEAIPDEILFRTNLK
ncbi:protein-glutamate methylesterase/protein-glutamine glutaminase [Polynucleobacter nymphae]|uniref:protein-glutamate methylesterase/protein-glutamine glutaminase n=1 Tax=Polynucleobacter nymphae TaxID=2081043 RepID=UPI001C0B6E7E|nr:chemotaxis response regulator protein-glutamate methylesterase [Polynucleobacter nymphae]MBU3606931.1 chemotaxis response regulator protein-glutamate methylesterase [Polynucleobacter nymphae]